MITKFEDDRGKISDWEAKAKEKGLATLATALSSQKAEDYQRLKRSGLPVFPDLILPYLEFRRDNEELMRFLEEHGQFIFRVLNERTRERRNCEDPVSSFEECMAFSEQKVPEGEEGDYKCFLTAFEPQDRAGVIISSPRLLRIEVGESLIRLSHGREDPAAGCVIDFSKVGHVTDKTKWYVPGNKKSQDLVARSLRYLELTRDSFNPHYRRGYFELVVTLEDEIKFLDFKVSEGYFK